MRNVRRSKPNVFRSSRGTTITEAALILPVLVLLIFGGIDISRMLYNKYVIQSALTEALLAAKSEEGLNTSAWDLEADEEFEQFRELRREVINKAEAIIQKRLLGKVNLFPVQHLDRAVVGGVVRPFRELDDDGLGHVAYLPPRYSANVAGWPHQNIWDGNDCEAKSEAEGLVDFCDTDDADMVELSREYPTKLVAFAQIPTLLLGTKYMVISAEAFVPGSNGDGNSQASLESWDSPPCGPEEGRGGRTDTECAIGPLEQWDACFLASHVTYKTDGTAAVNCTVTKTEGSPPYVVDFKKRRGQVAFRRYKLSERQVELNKPTPPVRGTHWELAPESQAKWDKVHAKAKINKKTRYIWYLKYNTAAAGPQWIIRVRTGGGDSGNCSARCIKLENSDD